MSTNQRIFGLDALRATAILSVVAFHFRDFGGSWPETADRIFSMGWSGVDIFFVLSGYLIGSQVFDTPNTRPLKQRFREFWIRRWTRTLPAYYVALFVYVVVKPVFLKVPFYGGFHWTWLIFFQNYHEIRDFAATWSLCIEEQFYLVFPLLAFLLRNPPRWIWLLPLAVSVAARSGSALSLGSAGLQPMSSIEYLHTFRFPTLMMLDSISLGVYLAATRDVWQKWPANFRNVLGVAGVLAALATMQWAPEFPQRPVQIAVMYVSLALSYSALLICLERFKSSPPYSLWISAIAQWSYSIYLWHSFVIRAGSRVSPILGPWLTLALTLAGIFSVSYLSFRWIELSGLRFRDRLLKR